MKIFTSMESNKQFRREHNEAQRAYKFGTSEIRKHFYLYKRVHHTSFEAALADIRDAADKLGAKLPDDCTMRAMWETA